MAAAREGMSVVGRGLFLSFVPLVGAFVLLVEIFFG
jgi:hypothetical protein